MCQSNPDVISESKAFVELNTVIGGQFYLIGGDFTLYSLVDEIFNPVDGTVTTYSTRYKSFILYLYNGNNNLVKITVCVNCWSSLPILLDWLKVLDIPLAECWFSTTWIGLALWLSTTWTGLDEVVDSTWVDFLAGSTISLRYTSHNFLQPLTLLYQKVVNTIQKVVVVISCEKVVVNHSGLEDQELPEEDWSISKKKRNQLQHAISGNIRKFYSNFSDILFQNIPGQKGLIDLQISLDILLAQDPTILAIGEACYNDLLLCHYPGYHLIQGRQSNPVNKKLRCNIFVKVGLPIEEIDITCEVPTCSIRYGGWNLVFLYREWAKGGDQDTRPIPEQISRWKTFIPHWLALSGKTMVMGDFNFCFLNHGNTQYQKQFEPIRETILDNFLLHGWSQLIQEETRYQTNAKPSLLDHAYANDLSYFDRVYNFSHIDSDHNSIGVRLRHDGPVRHLKIIEKRDLKGIDREEFERLYLTQNLWTLFSEENVDVAVWRMNMKILNVLNRLSPKKTIVAKKLSKRWISPEIKAELMERTRLHNRAKQTGDQEDWRRYKTWRNQLRNKMRRAEDTFTRDWLNQDDEKTKWHRVKTMAGLDSANKSEMEIKTNYGVTKSGPILSSFMNNFFKEKVQKLKAKTNPNVEESNKYTRKYLENNRPLFQDGFHFKTVSISQLKKHVKALSNTSSIGVDDIPTYIVKTFSNVLLSSILHVVNLSITKAQYPDLYKTGYISPIPKKGNLQEASNWRPIVLNAIISKLLERVLNEQINDYMRANLLDPTTQHAYRFGKSCGTAWAELDTFIQKNRNDGMCVGLILTDQSAAFNVLQKEIHGPKLKMLGFHPSALKMIMDYLTGRKTKCMVNGHLSDTVDLDSGVGEGSVLGPTLYTLGQICASMVPEIVKEELLIQKQIKINTHSVEYADDVTGCVAARNDDLLQVAVDKMMDQYDHYFSSAGLCLNRDKCAVIVLRSKPKTRDIIMNGKVEERKVKLLGIWLDSKYEFDHHVKYLTQIVSYKISCLKKVANWLTDKNLRMVVSSLVLSHLTYCSEIYLRLAKTRKKVQKLLNAAARLALRETRYANCQTMMETLGWLNMDNEYYSQLLLSFRRLKTTGAGAYTLSWLDWKSRAGLRTKLTRILWKSENNHGRYSYLQAAVKTWNKFRAGLELSKNPDWKAKDFKEWIHVKAKNLNGNPNL